MTESVESVTLILCVGRLFPLSSVPVSKPGVEKPCQTEAAFTPYSHPLTGASQAAHSILQPAQLSPCPIPRTPKKIRWLRGKGHICIQHGAPTPQAALLRMYCVWSLRTKVPLMEEMPLLGCLCNNNGFILGSSRGEGV